MNAILLNRTSPNFLMTAVNQTDEKFVSKNCIWIQKLLKKFSAIFSFSFPSRTTSTSTTLNCHDQGVICLSKDSTSRTTGKHSIDLHFHFIC